MYSCFQILYNGMSLLIGVYFGSPVSVKKIQACAQIPQLVQLEKCDAIGASITFFRVLIPFSNKTAFY